MNELVHDARVCYAGGPYDLVRDIELLHSHINIAVLYWEADRKNGPSDDRLNYHQTFQ